MRMKQFIWTGVGLLLTSHAHAQQPFTYQGLLRDGAGPANGPYDLSFALFPAPTGGTRVAGPITQNGVNVSNGLFTAELDFGAVWTGADRWLEISVNNT